MPWVVFDIGGVMVRIRGTWGESADAAGAPIREEIRARKQSDFSLMDPYQAGQVETEVFVDALREYLGTRNGKAAVAVHNGMLAEGFDGIADLVGGLKRAGVSTACLSNTNELHWPILRGSGTYPGIDSLDLPVASHVLKQAKPHAEIYRSFERIASAEPNDLFYFDDHPDYIAAAQALGWNATRIDPDNGPANQIRAALAQFGVL